MENFVKYYSQFGEDRLLHEMFGECHDGTCVEIGANDGFSGSNTYFFEKLGWRCVLVEPNAELCQQLRANRAALVFECAVSDHDGEATFYIGEGFEGGHQVSMLGTHRKASSRLAEFGLQSRPVQVALRKLDAVLEDAQVGPIDFMTIDVEGHELSVLGGFNLARWRPRVVILEDNSDYADGRVRRHMYRHGYVAFRRTGVNDWFARNEDFVIATPESRRAYQRERRRALPRMAATQARRIIRRVPGAVWARRMLLGR